MEKYKTDILTVEGFLLERPDMEVHTDKTIQSAIFQVAAMLNAKCGGLIEKVWNYVNGDDVDTNHVYYRTNEQLGYIKQAFIEQTQYNINIGNDYSQGGGSYSIGNINASFSRPEHRDIFAPMVEYLLQQAKVLDLQNFLSPNIENENNNCMLPELEYDCKCLTENYADKTYLKIYQPNVEIGRIATINNANIITFEPIQTILDLSDGLNAKKIFDPKEQIYKEIDKFSVEYFGGLSASTIYGAIYASGVVWNPQIPYQKDWVVLYQVQDEIGYYKYAKSLVDNNLNHNPNNSPNEWEILPIEPFELQAILDYINNKINALPQLNYISEGNGEIISFESESDFETFKNTMNVDDSYFQDVNAPSVSQDEFNNLLTRTTNLENNLTELQTYINNLTSQVNNKQNRIVVSRYRLRDVYYGVSTKIINGSGGSINGQNTIFGVISTTLAPAGNDIFYIETKNALGDYNADVWFRGIECGVYTSQNRVNVFINKLYDTNWDGDYYKDNLYIVRLVIR